MDVATILRSKGSEVTTAPPETSVADIAQILKGQGIGAIVISSGGAQVHGIVSERDILRALADHGAEILDREVSEFMTAGVFTCSPEDRVNDLMAIMTERRIRHLPVTVDGELTGIVTIGDLVKHRLDEIEREADALRSYISSI